MDIFGEHFVTCGQMKLLEKRADEDGLFYYQMMENAGTKAGEIILDRVTYKEAVKEDRLTESESVLVAEGISSDMISETERRPCALIFCGKGNNGGDGFVVARLLHKAGWRVVVILSDGEPQTVDSRINYGLLSALDIEIKDLRKDDELLENIDIRPDIIVDAVYGTGFHGRLKDNGLKCASYINRRGKNVTAFALDIPSGLGGDLIEISELERNSVKADYTIAFHAKKPVHLQKFAAQYCGKVVVADIGIDEKRLMDADRV